jgi:hypothetical protein
VGLEENGRRLRFNVQALSAVVMRRMCVGDRRAGALTTRAGESANPFPHRVGPMNFDGVVVGHFLACRDRSRSFSKHQCKILAGGTRFSCSSISNGDARSVRQHMLGAEFYPRYGKGRRLVSRYSVSEVDLATEYRLSGSHDGDVEAKRSVRDLLDDPVPTRKLK